MMRKGFTLVECMLAGSIFCLMTLALFECLGVSSKVARENSELLAAEAVAWDATWKRFNEPYNDLLQDKTTGSGAWRTLSGAAIPQFAGYDTPVKIRISVTARDIVGWSNPDMLKIQTDVEWGQAARRHRLSEYGETPTVYRTNMGREF